MSTSVEMTLEEALRIGSVVFNDKIEVLNSTHDAFITNNTVFIDSARSLVPRLMEAGATFKVHH